MLSVAVAAPASHRDQDRADCDEPGAEQHEAADSGTRAGSVDAVAGEELTAPVGDALVALELGVGVLLALGFGPGDDVAVGVGTGGPGKTAMSRVVRSDVTPSSSETDNVMAYWPASAYTWVRSQDAPIAG
jgi:hypothetical protein